MSKTKTFPAPQWFLDLYAEAEELMNLGEKELGISRDWVEKATDSEYEHYLTTLEKQIGKEKMEEKQKVFESMVMYKKAIGMYMWAKYNFTFEETRGKLLEFKPKTKKIVLKDDPIDKLKEFAEEIGLKVL